MSPSPGKRLGSLAATAAIAVAAAALPATALGAAGETTLALNGPAAKALRSEGVRTGAIGAARGSEQIVLPVSAGLAGSATTLLSHRGAFLLRAKAGKRLRFDKLALVLDKRSRVTATLGGDDIDLFRVLPGGQRSVDPSAGAVELAGLRLKLTGEAVKAIAAKLTPSLERKATRKWSRRSFGTLSASVSGLTAAGSPTPQTSTPKAGGCPLPSGPGPAPENPLPVATRPPSASSIAAAAIDWHVRESFIRYIGTGEGTSVSAGATADAPVLLPGASAPLSYDFHFPFAEGWLDTGADPVSPADDTAAIGFSGAVRFLYSGHGIDLTTSAPEIEIAGAKSRAIFTLSDSGKAAERQVLVNLDLSRAGAIAANGKTYTYERVPGAIPSGTASSVFAGFYAPGTDFGCFTVSFTSS